MRSRGPQVALEMAPEVCLDDVRVAALKATLRGLGFYVRYTEWPLGHEVVLHWRADTSRHVVTGWHVTELGAWEEALRLADEWLAARRSLAEPGDRAE